MNPRLIRTVHIGLGTANLTATVLMTLATVRVAYDHEPHWTAAFALAVLLLAFGTLRHAAWIIGPDHHPARTPTQTPADEPRRTVDTRQPLTAQTVAIQVEAIGGHETSSYALTVAGHRQDGTPDEQTIVLPRPAAAPLIGSLVAHLHVHDGEAAAGQLIADFMRQYSDIHTRMVIIRDTSHPDTGSACCQAGHRTAGREHTCTKARP